MVTSGFRKNNVTNSQKICEADNGLGLKLRIKDLLTQSNSVFT